MRNVGLTFLIALVTGAIMSIGISPQVDAITGGIGLLDTRLFYTLDEVNALFLSLGQMGLQFYTYQKIVDMVFPLGYGLPLAFLQAMALKKIVSGESSARLLTLLPIAGMTLDYIENILIWSQIIAFPSLSALVVSAAAAATILKWTLLGASFVVLIITGIYSKVKPKET